MVGEPFPALGVEVVVSDPVSAGGGVDESPVTGVDSDVADSAALGEEH
jgi:hypothetical protein